MNKTWLGQLVIFVIVLIALNYFFAWHISIIGSLALTIGLGLLFRLFQPPG